MTDRDAWEPEAAPLVRPYVITKGRELPDEEQLSLITLVTAAPADPRRPARLSPEEQTLLDLCSAGYLSVAEIAGHTQLPLGVVRILLSSLAEGGHLVTRPPVAPAALADREILQEVLNGLRAKFG
jgi:DNA-directed RNA polymerase specialized sigma24 family protein